MTNFIPSGDGPTYLLDSSTLIALQLKDPFYPMDLTLPQFYQRPLEHDPLQEEQDPEKDPSPTRYKIDPGIIRALVGRITIEEDLDATALSLGMAQFQLQRHLLNPSLRPEEPIPVQPDPAAGPPLGRTSQKHSLSILRHSGGTKSEPSAPVLKAQNYRSRNYSRNDNADFNWLKNLPITFSAPETKRCSLKFIPAPTSTRKKRSTPGWSLTTSKKPKERSSSATKKRPSASYKRSDPKKLKVKRPNKPFHTSRTHDATGTEQNPIASSGNPTTFSPS